MSDSYIDSPSIPLSHDGVTVKYSTSSAETTHLHTHEMVKFSNRIMKDPSTSNPNQIT